MSGTGVYAPTIREELARLQAEVQVLASTAVTVGWREALDRVAGRLDDVRARL